MAIRLQEVKILPEQDFDDAIKDKIDSEFIKAAS